MAAETMPRVILHRQTIRKLSASNKLLPRNDGKEIVFEDFSV